MLSDTKPYCDVLGNQGAARHCPRIRCQYPRVVPGGNVSREDTRNHFASKIEGIANNRWDAMNQAKLTGHGWVVLNPRKLQE